MLTKSLSEIITRDKGKIPKKKLIDFLQKVFVVYFHQQMGAPHVVRWLKSFVFVLNKFFWHFFCHKHKKDRKAVIKLQ